jgi:beta-lactamase class A
MLSRRQLIATAVALPFATAAPAAAAPQGALAQLERRAGGRLGVAAFDSETGQRLSWRGAERFALCSTFKLLAVAAVLQRAQAGQETLDRWIPYGSADLLEYAPVTRAHLNAGGMTLAALCAAAIQYSDNTAANLLLASLGGPRAVTVYARSLGDGVTRLDRTEPTLNSALPGDPRDTTTPNAMLQDARVLLLGEALAQAPRQSLTSWLMSGQTGATLIRAGLPRGWSAGDKSGRGGNGSTNDVAIIVPPTGKPALLAVYFTGSSGSAAAREAVVAEAARVALSELPRVSPS